MRLANFRTHALANMMDVEAILCEIYTARVAGLSDFAMFDGGAHRAYHTLRMLALPGCGRVHAVEADPFMAQTFRDIIGRQEPEAAKRVVLHQAALQDDPQRHSIPWKSSPSHVGRSSIVSTNPERNTIWGDNPDMVYRDEMSVPSTTIDGILDTETLPLPFLKSDLEGADLIALKGAETTLKNKRPVIAFENSVHAPKVHGFTIVDMVAYFGRLGYVPMNFAGERMSEQNWFGFFEAWLVPTELQDWLAKQLDAALSQREL